VDVGAVDVGAVDVGAVDVGAVDVEAVVDAVVLALVAVVLVTVPVVVLVVVLDAVDVVVTAVVGAAWAAVEPRPTRATVPSAADRAARWGASVRGRREVRMGLQRCDRSGDGRRGKRDDLRSCEIEVIELRGR
jgi:hypothetical protein